MKKIKSITKGVTEAVKADFKEKRILKALEMAKLNAQEKFETAKAELDEFPMHAAVLDANTIVTMISDKIDAIELAQATLDRLKKVEDYLNEDVTDEK